jgi:hypothetical protein
MPLLDHPMFQQLWRLRIFNFAVLQTSPRIEPGGDILTNIDRIVRDQERLPGVRRRDFKGIRLLAYCAGSKPRLPKPFNLGCGWRDDFSRRKSKAKPTGQPAMFSLH